MVHDQGHADGVRAPPLCLHHCSNRLGLRMPLGRRHNSEQHVSAFAGGVHGSVRCGAGHASPQRTRRRRLLSGREAHCSTGPRPRRPRDDSYPPGLPGPRERKQLLGHHGSRSVGPGESCSRCRRSSLRVARNATGGCGRRASGRTRSLDRPRGWCWTGPMARLGSRRVRSAPPVHPWRGQNPCGVSIRPICQGPLFPAELCLMIPRR